MPKALCQPQGDQKAIQNQVEQGFSFVELLSPVLPVGNGTRRGKTGIIIEKMIPVFPGAGIFQGMKRHARKAQSFTIQGAQQTTTSFSRRWIWVCSATCIRETKVYSEFQDHGFEVRRLRRTGVLTAEFSSPAAGMQENLEVSWIPSTAGKRGGSANASVVLSKDPVGSPLVVDPDIPSR